MKLFIKRLDYAKDIPLPKYMTEGSVGMDLYATVENDKVIEPNRIELIPTGISIELPLGYEAQIRPRSGLALKYGISMVNTPGTIDSDYRGEIKIIMINFGHDNFVIHRGDRIAQMVINKIELPEIVEINNLNNSNRNNDGFGSTGL